jgi:hypothetical protein
VLRRYNGICKGCTILHWDITCRPIREWVNKGDAEQRRHSRRSLIDARYWKWILEGKGVLQHIGVFRRAYVRTLITLCLMLDDGSRQRHGTSWFLDPVYRMDNDIRRCCQNVLVDGKTKPLIFYHHRKPAERKSESASSSFYNLSMISSSVRPDISLGNIDLMARTVERADRK